MWENAYSSLKSVERPINIYVYYLISKVSFIFCNAKYILGDVLHRYVKNLKTIFSVKKCLFFPRMHTFIFYLSILLFGM